MKKHFIIAVVSFIMGSLSTYFIIQYIAFSKQQSKIKEFLTTKTGAVNYLKAKIIEEKIAGEVNHYWATSECALYFSFDKGKYFDIEVHEKHDKNCPGAPETMPSLGNIRIDKHSGEIFSYDPIHDQYINIKK